MKKYSFAVICKGSVKIGLGHLFRAKAFAKYLKQEGYSFIIVAITDQYVQSALNGLNNNTLFFDSEKGAIDYLLNNEFDILVFDTITFSKEYIISLKKRVSHISSISPVFNSMSHVDSLFTRLPNFDANNSPFAVYSGLEYVILNDNVKPISDTQYKQNRESEPLSIGVAMGGADSANNTKKVITALKKINFPLTIWAILGEGYNHSYTELAEIIKRDKKHEIILARTNQTMWKILGNCIFAITSGGLTYNEAVFAGLPVINLFESDEHAKRIPSVFASEDIGFNMGTLSNESLKKTTDLIEKLISEPELLYEMRKRMVGKIDGNASERIVNKIISNI